MKNKCNINIKLVPINQIDEAFVILNNGKETLFKRGLTQWQNGLPNKELLLNDIGKNILYGLYLDKKLIGIFALSNKIDPSYVHIDGKWLNNNDDYFTIHTLAIKKEFLGQGYSKMIMDFAIKKAMENHFTSIRIDTHINNEVMINLIKKFEFTNCGIITLVDEEVDNKRLVFEKLLIN